MQDIPFENDQKEALPDKPGHQRQILNLVLAQEMGLWRVLSYIPDRVRLPENSLLDINIEEIRWAEQPFRGDQPRRAREAKIKPRETSITNSDSQ